MAKLLQLRRGTTAENDLFTGNVAEVTYDTDKKEIRVHDGVTAGGKIVASPVGSVIAFAGNTAPDGWLVCDGSAVSRTTYAALFAVISTIYGVGDGSTTFNLPNLSDCFVQGGTSGTTHSAGLPNITGSGTGFITSASTSETGALKFSGGSSKDATSSGGYWKEGKTLSIDASLSSTIYGNSTTVQPKSVEMLMCIKY